MPQPSGLITDRGPKVQIIMVNWNGGHFLQRSIQASLASSYGNIDLLVVDNASSDGSASLVTRHHGGARLLQLSENRGWGAGINAGLAHTAGEGSDFFLFMNNDVYLQPDAVEAMVSCARRHPEYGILSPILTMSGSGFTYAGGHFTQLGWWTLDKMSASTGSEVQELEVVTGAAMLVRREVVRSIGGFDPEFFLYREDVDYCRRARSAGFRVGAALLAGAVHDEGASTTMEADRPVSSGFDSDRIYSESFVKYVFKHLEAPELLRWLMTKRGRSSIGIILRLWPTLAMMRRRRRMWVDPSSLSSSLARTLP